MTFCLGIKVREGLVGISDTRISAGSETIKAPKVSTFLHGGKPIFLLTSGLRSVRDKTLIYFEEMLAAQTEPYDKLYKALNGLAICVRRVEMEDNVSLRAAGLFLDLHCIVGGQLAQDPEPRLFLMYPQGNWVEIGQGTPYQIVGIGSYGRPVLDRTLRYDDSLQYALKVGCVAFDSTRIAVSDVDFPIDATLYRAGTYQVVRHTFTKDDLASLSTWWGDRLRGSMQELPDTPLQALMAKVPFGPE